MTIRCPKGHDSDEPDYCSICGAQILSAKGATASAAATRVATATASAGSCPSCGEARSDPDARFCEVCRFDFVAGKGGPPPVARLTPVPAPIAAPVPAPPPAPLPMPGAPPPVRPAPFVTATREWSLEITVDPSLDTEPDPSSPCPVGAAPVLLAVDRDELLIGRRDDRRDIKPDVPLNDPGASRRHAKIVRNADGSLALQDLASTNGTKLNAEEVPAGGRKSLREGDAVTIGRWTRLTVRARS
jgi:hypothetical protein